jgi:allantoinase
MGNELYEFSPITEREPIVWPDGKRLAFYIGLNVEHFDIDKIGFGALTVAAPDPMNHGVRDYGNRVGIWRMIKLFDEVGLRVSAITNSEVCLNYPQIVQAGIERDWAWIAHGKNNSTMHTGFASEAEEATFLDEMLATFDAALPTRPKGWLGPGLTETFWTAKLLRERGFEYLLDWNADDRPFDLKIPGMIEVPYNLDVNDIAMFMGKTVPGSFYEEMAMDQFEVLLGEGGNVMALPIHPFVIGQPYRFKYFERVIRAITSHPDVWVTTSDDIAAHYLAGR